MQPLVTRMAYWDEQVVFQREVIVSIRFQVGSLWQLSGKWSQIVTAVHVYFVI